MFDYHVHTSFSADSKLPMEQACQAAVDKGVTEIAFTEHLDYYYPNCPLTFEFDYDEYACTVDEMRDRFGGRLYILKAVEIGLHSSVKEKNEQFVRGHQFDFIIGSVHIADDLDLHNGDYFKGKSLDEALELYFETVYYCVQDNPFFHVLGHLDLIKRYVHYLQADPACIDWRRYDQLIGETLKQLIKTGRGIEVNMSGYRYKLNCTLPELPLIRLYRQLGGEIITVGSDAHHQAHIAHHFERAYNLLEEAGFKYVTVYREGQPHFVPISKMGKLTEGGRDW
ncbi:histidinol phosphate phosphatase HisJ family [Caldalkalibacillus thermarum TA2.A1]|uniref:Histidinol-phosphatase n=1 Tax=Caldalkalibacillus thermarum (strain TA2.A1) TaxID=986075 RepID=F5LAV5_CALTT|nr:histidinol-phosphatase HisJ family protein [Caldalkalibacillus thermarum]EGL81494.1 histidinol phosphate phosphatase HisJ family [Caldalkalibacillus thermarum TA2.A1]QZT33797.1 histidinol-phosphatase HisJ family protein [Caldalkalibacillus thermarum TA2.A1]